LIEHDDFAVEPVPGLPEDLPDGEVMLWQGAPDWKVMARRAFHLPLLGMYFLLMLAVKIGFDLLSGIGVAGALLGAVGPASLGLFAGGMFALYAWLMARGTVYTITNKRLVMRFGVALPMTFNVPFAQVRSAAVKCFADGFGDIPVTLEDDNRISYIVMWPNVRPWRFKKPEPMLRSIPDAVQVAELLADAASRVAPVTATGQAMSEDDQDQLPVGDMA
jgi:hypothetical protein